MQHNRIRPTVLAFLALCLPLYETAYAQPKDPKPFPSFSEQERVKAIEGSKYLVNDKKSLDQIRQIPASQLCLENESSLYSQPWQVGPSPFDVSSTEPGVQANFKSIFNLEMKGSYIGSGNTLILVADDFSNVSYIKGSNNKKMSHGYLVISHIRKIIESTKLYNKPTISGQDIIYKSTNGKQRIYIRRIHPSGFFPVSGTSKTLLDAGSLAASLDAQQHNGNFTRMILNMSFIVLPCRISLDYDLYSKSKGKYGFDDYISDYFRKNRAMIDKITYLPDNNKLTASIINLMKVYKSSLAVAASGNFSTSYQFAPASRPEVIGVGSVNWNALGSNGFSYVNDGTSSHTKSEWSNPGDTYSPGGFFNLSSKDLGAYCGIIALCPVSDRSEWPYLSYQGTSFSAPSLTTYLAMRSNNPSCFSSSGNRFNIFSSSSGYEPLGKWIQTSSTPPKRPVFKGGSDAILNNKC